MTSPFIGLGSSKTILRLRFTPNLEVRLLSHTSKFRPCRTEKIFARRSRENAVLFEKDLPSFPSQKHESL